jgi:hypothetical protein
VECKRGGTYTSRVFDRHSNVAAVPDLGGRIAAKYMIRSQEIIISKTLGCLRVIAQNVGTCTNVTDRQ